MPLRPPRHQPARGRLHDGRPSASARGYDVYWRRFRLVILAKRPVCEECQRKPAVDIDHVVSLERGGAKYDESNLRALCKSCHSRKTVREDGGFGRPA